VAPAAPSPLSDSPILSPPTEATLINNRQWIVTPQEIRRVQLLRTISKDQPEYEVICTHHNIDYARRHLERLKDGTWLTDESINAMMSNLNQYDVSMCQKYKQRRSSHCFSSFFMDRLLNVEPKFKQIVGYTYVNVTRWTKKFNIFDKSKVFFPVNIEDTHWVLMIAYMQESRIVYLDSFGGAGENAYTRALKTYIVEEAFTKYDKNIDISKWTVDDFNSMRMEWDLHRQTNNFDCGMFVIMWVDYILDSLRPNFTQMDLIHCRSRVSTTILTGSMNYSV
jgi:sentrin-specific protease 1